MIPLSRARRIGVAAIGGVLLLQAFNSFACYGHGFGEYLQSLAFLAIPLIPALVGLATLNPLRALGACLLFAPWLVLAYWTDCVRPYMGGGASMIYVAVLLWGTPSSLAGALLTGPVMRLAGVSLADDRARE